MMRTEVSRRLHWYPHLLLTRLTNEYWVCVELNVWCFQKVVLVKSQWIKASLFNHSFLVSQQKKSKGTISGKNKWVWRGFYSNQQFDNLVFFALVFHPETGVSVHVGSDHPDAGARLSRWKGTSCRRRRQRIRSAGQLLHSYWREEHSVKEQCIVGLWTKTKQNTRWALQRHHCIKLFRSVTSTAQTYCILNWKCTELLALIHNTLPLNFLTDMNNVFVFTEFYFQSGLFVKFDFLVCSVSTCTDVCGP